MSKLDEIDGAWEWFEVAKERGITYPAYYKRILRGGMSPEEAATQPPSKGGRPVNPRSIRQRCKRAGISRRSFTRVREELRDEGIEHTIQDVIEIVQAKKEGGRP